MTVTVTYTLEPGDELDASHATAGLPTGQFNGDVTALSDGGFAVAYLQPFFGPDIPRFAINGGTGKYPFNNAVSFSHNTIGTPVVTTLANGNLAIVWKESASGGDGTIFSSVYDVAAGTYTAREVSIAANAALTDPEVTAFSDGFFGIVATDGTDVYFRFMNQDGTITDGFAPFVVGPGGSIPALDPAVATLTDNGFVVTYKHGANVEARIYDINGNQRAPLGGIVVDDVGTGGSAKVAATTDNAFLVVYDDQSGTPGIYLRGFNSQGQGGDPVRVDVGLGQADVADPQITILKNGFILVTYTNVFDDGAGGTDLDVVGRVFDPGGTPCSWTAPASSFSTTRPRTTRAGPRSRRCSTAGSSPPGPTPRRTAGSRAASTSSSAARPATTTPTSSPGTRCATRWTAAAAETRSEASAAWTC